MTVNQRGEPIPARPIRLWPGVAIVAIQWLIWMVVPAIASGAGMFAMLGGAAGGLAVLVWWLFFSRAPWLERVGAIVLMVAAVFVTLRLVHESIATAMMGMMLPIYVIPAFSLALVVWAAASRGFSRRGRWASMVGAIALACAAFTILRTGGVTGEGSSELHWRWTPTPEQRLLARAGDDRETAALSPGPTGERIPVPAGERMEMPAAAPAVAKELETRVPDPAGTKADADWPGFRGPDRDGVARGVRIGTDWSRMAPVEIWRQPVGPGWSSFAVHGELFYTQEQRGEDEVVSCYNLTTGAPVWRHGDAVRFWESNAGAGPRATPAVSDGRVYTFGATGILNALDARDGAVIWSRDAASDTKTKVPMWGFASSPLVLGDAVIVATSGVLAAYDAATGEPRWFGPAGGSGYSSPQLATIDGVKQVLLLNGNGVTGVSPADGALLWAHEWKGDGIVQPSVIGGADVLLGSGSGLSSAIGIRRVTVAQGAGGWSVEERWTSNGLKPYYNDFVVHQGHAYGFDGSILACIDLQDGKRKWKGGRYGHGQLVLLPDQDLLLALSEQGELALVKATPDQFAEVARFPLIEGKTWNHPALAGGILLARNGEEMAAFRLPVAER
ncbi:MAG: PQQ-binding-like beta-propeller repeat protein [Bryobacteraceae bacterium]|nr:PQQ-binding-like beta-propeller repeat protein [Bryobacteraceae bacterium]